MYNQGNEMKRLYINIIKIVFIITAMYLYSCATTRNDKIVKRKSKIIREAKVFVFAEKLTVISDIKLKIREHHVFDLFESGMFWKYYSGTWEYRNDTLFLEYFNNHRPYFSSDYALCDTIKKRIIFKYKLNNSTENLVLNYKGNFK